MILVTVGTQLAFDRLLSFVDNWAPSLSEPVIAQVGPSNLKFRHVLAQPFMRSDEMEKLFVEARIIVAHAGMGSILNALKHQKPIVIIPRKAALGEHRNEHQLATARWVQSRPGVTVAWEPEQLPAAITRAAAAGQGTHLSPHAPAAFVQRVSDWINR